VIAGILSDLDGVLVDSGAAHTRAWIEWAERHGLPDPPALAQAAHGIPAPEAVALLAPHLDADVEGRVVELAQTADTDGVVALPGAADVLSSGIPLALVTSASVALASARLRAAGLERPERMVTVEDISRGKPDPEPYLRGAALLGLAPADCVVLEDAPAGVTSGKAAGCTVVGVLTTHRPEDLAAADLLIPDLSELWTALPSDR
jgi:sugar-phosphatase